MVHSIRGIRFFARGCECERLKKIDKRHNNLIKKRSIMFASHVIDESKLHFG